MTVKDIDKKFILQILGVVGIPGIIAMYMVYWLTSGLSAQTNETRDMLKDHTKSSTQMITVLEKIEKKLTTLCVNESMVNGGDPRSCLE